MRKIVAARIAAFIAVVCVHCHSQYRPLEAADECACKPSEYCKVSPPGRAECLALPVACGARPTCDCVGEARDACRDDDGRITLVPSRAAPACETCSSEEYCIDGAPRGAVCRLLPPECAEAPSCACFLGTRGRSAKYACSERHGRLVASVLR